MDGSNLLSDKPQECVAHCVIRAARVGDALALQRITGDAAALTDGNFPAYSSPELWHERLKVATQPRSGDVLLVAEAGRCVIGHVQLRVDLGDYNRRHAANLSLCVDRGWRRRGVARSLMQAALQHADDWMGILRTEVILWTDNQAARLLYEQFGFKQEGVLCAYGLRQGRYADALLMARLHPTLLPSLR